MTFNYKDVYAKYGDHFPCALTGRPLDFNKPETYEYDHIIPTSRGGDNTIDNLQIVCPEANRAKQNLTDEEFLDLCKEVVLNKGYGYISPWTNNCKRHAPPHQGGIVQKKLCGG